jgi:hypothetical protein
MVKYVLNIYKTKNYTWSKVLSSQSNFIFNNSSDMWHDGYSIYLRKGENVSVSYLFLNIILIKRTLFFHEKKIFRYLFLSETRIG